MDLPAEISRSAFGRAVASRRAELHLTQEALSLRSGQHQKWISNVETARINPSLSNLARLAASLELRLSELIAHAEAIDAQGASPAALGSRQRQLTARPATLSSS
ncbi:MAG: helix-turn-helix domain-containing protein [Solirubrobacteraceae bacterium]